jgi:alanyl-tRNA synthetase
MTGNNLRQKYLDFFKSRGHVQIPSAPLVPENDPTTLFTGSGMQPMVPYLLGQPHPLGTRLVDSQKCFRSQDIESVGDNRHDSFFEMLGNWSLGDYFKKEQIPWVFQFLTDSKIGLGLDPSRIYITIFRGNEKLGLPRDEEAAALWQEQYSAKGLDHLVVDFPENKGLQGGRIFYYDEHKNWWSRADLPQNMPVGEPGGPSSEMFYDFGADLHLHENSPFRDFPCHVNCDCGRFSEIGNSVFMTYRKTPSGFIPLQKKNIDFGGGFERLLAVTFNSPDIFVTDIFQPIIKILEPLVGEKYSSDSPYSAVFRVISDHIKASVFLIADGVLPSNKAQGYFLRRLLRRAMIKIRKLTEKDFDYLPLIDAVISIYSGPYPELVSKKDTIWTVIKEEHDRFIKTLSKGLKEFNKLPVIDGKAAFDLFQSFGFPLEVTMELAAEKGLTINKTEFATEFKKHQELSRSASKGMFKGGLQDQSEITTRYHTATHLLHRALREILGIHVQQKGSNITAERLRFDFSHPDKLTSEQIQKVEDIVNAKIKENLTVTREEKPKKQALAEGALAFFVEKYPDIVSVYTIGPMDNWFSKELCGGPHVGSTGEIGRIKIVKEESAGSGIRRIYAQMTK